MAKVMIVDDSAFLRSMMEDILTRGGHTVIAKAGNGEEAIQMYISYRPEIVTMDITMPEMDGVSAVRHIKQVDPDAKIIICSAMGQRDMVIQAVAAGAKGFIVKPFQADRIINEIQKTLGQPA